MLYGHEISVWLGNQLILASRSNSFSISGIMLLVNES